MFVFSPETARVPVVRDDTRKYILSRFGGTRFADLVHNARTSYNNRARARVSKTGPVRVRVVLFRQRGRARGVSQVHPKDQEERNHAHERDGYHATGPVASQRRRRLIGLGGGGARKTEKMYRK